MSMDHIARLVGKHLLCPAASSRCVCLFLPCPSQARSENHSEVVVPRKEGGKEELGSLSAWWDSVLPGPTKVLGFLAI